jgi:hypothetical protein
VAKRSKSDKNGGYIISGIYKRRARPLPRRTITDISEMEAEDRRQAEWYATCFDGPIASIEAEARKLVSDGIDDGASIQMKERLRDCKLLVKQITAVRRTGGQVQLLHAYNIGRLVERINIRRFEAVATIGIKRQDSAKRANLAKSFKSAERQAWAIDRYAVEKLATPSANNKALRNTVAAAFRLEFSKKITARTIGDWIAKTQKKRATVRSRKKK